MTAVHYVNKQGGTVSRSLCHLAFSLWDFCIGLNITPVATNLLGTLNTLADAVSRGGPFPPRTTGGSCLASSSFPVLGNTIGGCVCLCSKQAMPSLLQQRPHRSQVTWKWASPGLDGVVPLSVLSSTFNFMGHSEISS